MEQMDRKYKNGSVDSNVPQEKRHRQQKVFYIKTRACAFAIPIHSTVTYWLRAFKATFDLNFKMERYDWPLFNCR
jgi:hypothetical protein